MVENIVSTKPVKKDEFYQDADDKNVAAKIVYWDSVSRKLYYNYDATSETPFTNEVPAEDLKGLFFNNAVCFNFYGGSEYTKAASYSESNGISWAYVN